MSKLLLKGVEFGNNMESTNQLSRTIFQYSKSAGINKGINKTALFTNCCLYKISNHH